MLSLNIKFGSDGEYESKAINSKIPNTETIIPIISIILLVIKINNELAIFFEERNSVSRGLGNCQRCPCI